jgi:sigma-B regulation protein RsbU (phosphoserine phosphatase)
LRRQKEEGGSMNILVVDDSANERTLLRHLLTKGGYSKVTLAESAAEALEKIRGPHPSGKTDLILMDILMPEMDGIEACRAIKSESSLRDVPVIMVTGLYDQENLESAFAVGATDYIVKPVKEWELLSRVGSAFRLRQEMKKRKVRERELEEEIGERERLKKKQEDLIRELRSAMDKIKTLSGLLPICVSCKKIRDDKGYWTRIEEYIRDHSEAEFTHGFCPDCVNKLYGDIRKDG